MDRKMLVWKLLRPIALAMVLACPFGAQIERAAAQTSANY